MGRLDPADRLFLGDHALADHVDGDLHGRGGRPLGAARLEHEQVAALDRELEVLDVAVVALETLGDRLELGVGRRQVAGQVADLLGRPDAGDDILALGVGQVLAVEDLLAGVGVAGEGDAGARVVAHVAEDHRDDVDRRAQVVADLLVLAIVVGALAEPRREDGLDRQVELVERVARELAAGLGLDDRLELLADVLEGGRVEVGVLLGAVDRLGVVEGLVELLGVDAHHDPAEHLDEPAIGVPAEALVRGQGDQAVQGVLVEAEVEDRVHHPGHRELGARADRDEERVGRVAEALAGQALDVLDRVEDVLPEALRQLLARREEVVARFGRDRETGRHGQPGDRHLREAGALAAEQVAHRRAAFRVSAAPGVDVALGSDVGAVGRGGLGHRGGRLLQATLGRAGLFSGLYPWTLGASGCGSVAGSVWRLGGWASRLAARGARSASARYHD